MPEFHIYNTDNRHKFWQLTPKNRKKQRLKAKPQSKEIYPARNAPSVPNVPTLPKSYYRVLKIKEAVAEAVKPCQGKKELETYEARLMKIRGAGRPEKQIEADVTGLKKRKP